MRLRWVPIFTALSACQTLSPAAQSNQPNETHSVPTVLDTPVEFVGSRGATINPELLGEIRIGLFAPTSPEHPVGLAMFEGANLAIEQVNVSGGLDGVPFRLLSRWDDDPWRGGSKEMIKLVYEDSVWAVIGSINGEATHVAEQVVTKAWLPLLSPVSADPTLTYIRIPWMFRLPPDDEKQAAVIVRVGITANSLSRVGLITSTDHDGRIFGQEMRERMSVVQTHPVFHLQVAVSKTELTEIAHRVSSFGPDGVIVRLPAGEILKLLDSFKSNGLSVPVLIPWVPGLRPSGLRGRYDGEILYVSPFSDTDNPSFTAFARDYQERYGVMPSPSAAYTFDAVNIVVQSLKESGLNRAGLRDAVAGASGYVGVTGRISWDNAGGNQTEPVLTAVPGAAATPGDSADVGAPFGQAVPRPSFCSETLTQLFCRTLRRQQPVEQQSTDHRGNG